MLNPPDYNIKVRRGRTSTIVTLADRTGETVITYATADIKDIMVELGNRLDLREKVNRG